MPDRIRVRIRFSKSGMFAYVGHLDMMRYFQKAVRRAEIPIAYSNGFHPHQIMSFALPLGMGITSSGEYMDIELKEDMEPALIKTKLDECMAKGVGIISAGYVAPNAKKSMAAVEAASYRIGVFTKNDDFDISLLEDGIRRFYLDQNEIIVVKKTKKSENEIDLKKLIYELEISGESVEMLISSGSQNNIKPEFVMENLMSFMGLDTENFRLGIHRNDMYYKGEDGCFHSMSECG